MWTQNQTDLIQSFIHLGVFPTRWMIFNLHGSELPPMPDQMVREMARISPWGYETWRDEWATVRAPPLTPAKNS